LLPVILAFVLRLINDERLTGDLKNDRLNNALGWGTFAMVTTAVVAMFALQVMELMGITF
jgi:Mn2+/Fe2+ NRAMP family transporter